MSDLTASGDGLPDWHVEVEGCGNFRDAGGWELDGGGRMRNGRLYRSDGPVRATSRGRAAVAALGLQLVVDLRQHAQFVRSPGFLAPELTAHVPLVDRVIDTDDPPEFESPADLADLYDGMLDAAAPQLASAIDLVASRIGDGPVLVHCSMGKDRAGLVSALVQAAIGVTRSGIVADYARSDAPTVRTHAWMLSEPLPGDTDLRRIPVGLFRAHAETMEILLDRMIERHGSLGAWARSFPVADDTVERLRAALVEPGAVA